MLLKLISINIFSNESKWFKKVNILFFPILLNQD